MDTFLGSSFGFLVMTLFQGILTTPSWQTFTYLACGWALARDRHTITTGLWLTGATTAKHFSRFYVFRGCPLDDRRWQLWAAVIRDVFENPCQFRHVQHDLTRLIVLPNKSLANMARCILDSADNTNLSRVLAEAPWREEAVNRRWVRFMLQQTKPHRSRRRESLVVIDDTLCELVGSLFDDVDRHDHRSDGTYPLAHHPVTSFSVSGPVRFPLGLRLYWRDEELIPWEAAVATHVPELKIPTERKARNRLHQQVNPTLLQYPECRARHEPFRTTIARAIELIEEAIRSQVPFGVVVFDAWYLAEDVGHVLARRLKDRISLLNTNRLLETARFHLRDAHGWTLKLPSPHIAAEELVPLIPVTVSEDIYWCFTLTVRIPGSG